MAEARLTDAEAREVRQPAARWAFRRRTQVICFAFFPFPPFLADPGKSPTSSSSGDEISDMDQLGFSIFTTTGVPRWDSFAHQPNNGAIAA
ncbi:hypothetical protein HPP92_012266 [Vanilla planifolia]|uniref:Uncharacterized protein n=1 Tax=Vanilla planifolia TaxID=51239 RepID=A0A835R0M4_VANPL|nr:hypothetical protein HPP92_012266 [Vanilla planifolia]